MWVIVADGTLGKAWSLLALLTVLIFLGVAPVQAQTPVDVTMRSAEVLESGQTRVVIDVEGLPPGAVTAGQVVITEDGEPVDDVEVTLASDVPDPEQRTVVVALDTSGSTKGEAIASAIAAVEAFTTTVTQRQVAVGLVTFADQAQLVVAPTTDASEVVSALAGVEATGETALFDAVVVAARTLENFSGQRSILVFSDGADTVSTAGYGGATNAATVVGADVTSVALLTDDFDPTPLQAMANATGGRVLTTSTANGLQAAFEEVALDMSNQYVLTYPSTGLTGQFTVETELTAGGATVSDSVAVLNAIAQVTAVPPTSTVVAATGLLGSETAQVAAVAATFVALLLLLLGLFLPTSDRKIARTMEVAIAVGGAGRHAHRDEITPTTAAMSRRAIRLIESVPKPEGYDEKTQQALDRASWPLRASEFTTLRVLATIIGLVVGWVLVGILFGLVLAILGWFVPRILLGQRVAARQKKFMEQLPDTLQLLAGSLKAGYGVMQAIDTVVKETEDPTASEFQRVLSEARLGLPLEDSLSDMADRIGTEDFRWVAVAINIQRRVGGNLAQLLETVAMTLRERAATRRQISALSAEGKLSAIILVALPFALAGYMVFVNPDYMLTLFIHPLGRLIMLGTSVLMVIGIFWMKRMIDIDV